MTITDTIPPDAAPSATPSHWLQRYYGTRALFSLLWVALAFTIGKTQPVLGTALLVIYPVWDCLANYADAARNGGLRANPSQALNVVVSAVVTLAVIVAISHDMHAAIGVIGVWAALSGVPPVVDRPPALAPRERAMAPDPERRTIVPGRRALRLGGRHPVHGRQRRRRRALCRLRGVLLRGLGSRADLQTLKPPPRCRRKTAPYPERIEHGS